ncbi:O-acyltransferase like protein-like [Hetaerina americana]|uniref:O-acyltransferase like protein-like n=1 Tax=Hetaerina americana TaxID=62018 RepID=UPI003A7F4054
MRGLRTSFPIWGVLMDLLVASLASGADASDFDPWDEPAWMPEGGGIAGPPFQPIPRNVSSDGCLTDSVAYVYSVDLLPTWARQMLGDSSDLREGFKDAFPPLLGEFEGCKSFLPTSDFLDIVGKYCVANVTLIGPEAISGSETGDEAVENYLLTFCASSLCSPAGKTQALQDFFNRTMEPYSQARAIVNVFECKTWRKEQPMHGGDIAALFPFVLPSNRLILLVFGVLVVVSTCYEGCMRKKRKEMSGTASRVLVSFSLLTNVPKLIAVTSGDSTMNFIFGLKFISISWIVFGHTFYSKSILPLTNPNYIGQFSKEWMRMLVLNESIAVDTFFLISGLLLAIMFLREQESGLPFNPILFYLHRILRLTPPYAIVIFFYATLFYRLGSGPVWDILIGNNTNMCRINWWTNILYVNNYVNINQPCMDHSWYLAVDTQFYLVSPIFLFLMYKYRRFRLYLFPIIVLIAVLVPFIITADMKLPGAIFFNRHPEDVVGVFTNVYTRAYARAGPYLVGMGLGFFLHKYKEKKVVIPKYLVAVGWMLSITSCLAVIFGVYGLMQLDHPYNVWESSFYAGLHRTVWAVGVGWVIFACCHGYAGPVNTILSWKLLTPLGRLTYCIYLIHYIVILYFAGSTRATVYFSINEVVRDFFGNLIIAIFVATALSLVFESPFIGISKAFVKRETKAPRSVIPKECVDVLQSNQTLDVDFPSARGEFSVEEGSGNSSEEIVCAEGDESPIQHAYSNSAYEVTP